MASLSWLMSMLTFATILAFNLFAMDALMRMRGDVAQIRKTTAALMLATSATATASSTAPPSLAAPAAAPAPAAAAPAAAAPAAAAPDAADPLGKKVQV